MTFRRGCGRLHSLGSAKPAQLSSPPTRRAATTHMATAKCRRVDPFRQVIEGMMETSVVSDLSLSDPFTKLPQHEHTHRSTVRPCDNRSPPDADSQEAPQRPKTFAVGDAPVNRESSSRDKDQVCSLFPDLRSDHTGLTAKPGIHGGGTN